MKLPNAEAIVSTPVESPAASTHIPGEYFTPDSSMEWEESGDLALFRFFESLAGEGNPQGRLADGRPFIQFTDIGPDFVGDHYLVDRSGLEGATDTMLRLLLLRSDIDWPVHLDPAVVRFLVQATHDDRGRAILDLEVRYPFSISESES
ncbi:MAG: hypothetical protein VCC00_10885 [Deltaproteobacteria bacterium]